MLTRTVLSLAEPGLLGPTFDQLVARGHNVIVFDDLSLRKGKNANSRAKLLIIDSREV